MTLTEYKNLKKYIKAGKKEAESKKYAKKVFKKINAIKGVLEDMLNPDIGDLAISHEIRGLHIDMATIWINYKKLVKAIRMYEIAEIFDDTKKYEEFLSYTNEIIEDLMKIVQDIMVKRISFWDKDIEYRKPKEYLG